MALPVRHVCAQPAGRTFRVGILRPSAAPASPTDLMASSLNCNASPPCERSNRPTAENRAEETLCAFVVAKLRAEPLKTEQSMVLYARE